MKKVVLALAAAFLVSAPLTAMAKSGHGHGGRGHHGHGHHGHGHHHHGHRHHGHWHGHWGILPHLILWGPRVYHNCPIVIIRGRKYFRCYW